MATRYPVSTVSNVRQAMDRLVGDAFSPSRYGTVWTATSAERDRALLPVDAYATDNEVVVLASIPGVAADALDILVEKNTLTISGSIPSVAKSDHAKGATWYVHELPSGSFRRSMTLPMDIDSAGVEATFENGVLRLVLPKAETAKPRQIKVQAGSPAEPTIADVTVAAPESEPAAEGTAV